MSPILPLMLSKILKNKRSDMMWPMIIFYLNFLCIKKFLDIIILA